MDSGRLLQLAIERGAADLRLSGGNLPPRRFADEMGRPEAVSPGAIHLSAIVHHAPGGCRMGLERLANAVGHMRPAWHGVPARPAGRFALRPDRGRLPASGESPVPAARRTARHQDGAPR